METLEHLLARERAISRAPRTIRARRIIRERPHPSMRMTQPLPLAARENLNSPSPRTIERSRPNLQCRSLPCRLQVHRTLEHNIRDFNSLDAERRTPRGEHDLDKGSGT